MKIKKISHLISLISLSLFIMMINMSNAWAEYYLVYSGTQFSCQPCYKRYYKKIKHHYTVPHKIKIHHPPHRCWSHPVPAKQYHAWIPGYWENGYWMPAHKVKYLVSHRDYYKIQNRQGFDYDLDLTTGDDNPYIHPGMDIDN